MHCNTNFSEQVYTKLSIKIYTNNLAVIVTDSQKVKKITRGMILLVSDFNRLLAPYEIQEILYKTEQVDKRSM